MNQEESEEITIFTSDVEYLQAGIYEHCKLYIDNRRLLPLQNFTMEQTNEENESIVRLEPQGMLLLLFFVGDGCRQSANSRGGVLAHYMLTNDLMKRLFSTNCAGYLRQPMIPVYLFDCVQRKL